MKTNGSVVLGIIALIMVGFACVVLVLYRVGGGRESTSKTVRYAGRLGKLLFAASVILIAIGLIAVPSGEGFEIYNPGQQHSGTFINPVTQEQLDNEGGFRIQQTTEGA